MKKVLSKFYVSVAFLDPIHLILREVTYSGYWAIVINGMLALLIACCTGVGTNGFWVWSSTALIAQLLTVPSILNTEGQMEAQFLFYCLNVHYFVCAVLPYVFIWLTLLLVR